MSVSVADETNVLLSMQNIVYEALHKLGYSDEYYELLKEPMRVLTVRIPVRMDDGTTRVFTGYRARHNDAAGPTSGGVRFHPNVTEEEIKALSIWMGLKHGLLDLPFGGGKGGVICDPRGMSFGELERLSRGYVRAICQHAGMAQDILSPDVLANAQVMAWMMDEYDHIREQDSRGYFTGKPLVLGGTCGREAAASKGAAIMLEEAAKRRGIPIRGAKTIIQGFDHAGSDLAKIMHEAGALIVGISDAFGALYNPEGLDIDYLMDNRDSFGAVTNLFRNTMTSRELLKQPCDILVPAGLQNQITADNADQIQAQIVAEAGNGLTSAEGTRILTERGILLVPDILANSGGVTVSYFEWVQNRQGYAWSDEEVDARLRQVLAGAFDQVYRMAETRKVNMRLAAYMVGIRKHANAMHLRGWV